MGGWWTALGVLVAASGSACGSASDRQVPVSIAIASASPSTPTAPVVTPCKNLVECSRSCERKEARSCGRLGEMYSLGAGVERDPLKAKAALERGCDLGGGDACATLAQLQRETGRAGAEVSASAARACEAGAGAGCSMLEPMVRHGLDIPIDLARADQLQAKALKLLATSCDAGDFNACFQLSPLVWDGVGAAADPAAGAKLKRRGMELQRRACANGDVLACDAAARRAS
ncbi:MAG: sel1 repeat family protein, partial [Polyangiaceae bacterium]|nr:sel1 repeat family protein [Polyangiaceae bacterium]